MASSSASTWHAPLRRLYRGGLKVLAASSVVGTAAVYFDYKAAKNVHQDSPKQKKPSVVVLPFYKMKLVEKKSVWSGDNIGSFPENEDSVVEVEVKELVETIHAAAKDPNIVALYGRFGHGFGFSAGGWAHIEEVRNALRVFKESNRVHKEPNRLHNNSTPTQRGNNIPPKLLWGYADTFANPMDPANKEYYLASIFDRLHMQAQGEVNLFGVSMTQPFLRNTLHKYGIKVHVFKQGIYKNAPNMFTEKGFVSPHLENTKSLLESINDHVYDGIALSRRGLNYHEFWDMVHGNGTFPASQAVEQGLVKYTPPLDPLDYLVKSNKNNPQAAAKEAIDKLGAETDVQKFEAERVLSWNQYSGIVRKRKRLEERKLRHFARLKKLSEKYIYVEGILSVLGYPAPFYNIKPEDYEKGMSESTREKIALVRIDGVINNDVAQKTVKALRKIKKDDQVKCVVLRVDSRGGSATAAETILQELKDIPQPSVCSMGNVAASAGYYVASNCNRIYALPTTITGSIGVFGLKLDLTGMASQYGANVQHVVTGPFSASNSLFQPLTKPIKDNMRKSIDRFYGYFKSHVSKGRGMSMDQVEHVARGRVFTGEQAKEVGLVDELGDLTRVIGYANNTFTSGHAKVEVWPKKPSFSEMLKRGMDGDEDDEDDYENKKVMVLSQFVKHCIGTFFYPTPPPPKQQDIAISQLLNGLAGGRFVPFQTLPPALSGVMMTMDETDAIRILLQDYSSTKSNRSLLDPK